jgi:hypothetical protein
MNGNDEELALADLEDDRMTSLYSFNTMDVTNDHRNPPPRRHCYTRRTVSSRIMHLRLDDRIPRHTRRARHRFES